VTRVAIVAATTSIRTQLESVVSRSSSLSLSAAAATIDAIARDPRLASSEVLLLHGAATEFGARDLEALPPIPIIALLRGPVSDAGTVRLLAIGVRGVLPDDSTAEEIGAAIEAAVVGLVVLPPEQVGELVRPRAALLPERDVTRPRVGGARVPPLTPREQEILGMLAEGLPNKGIAARLGISDHTVKTHLEAIFDKLGASTRAEAVARAVRAGLLLL
jgi:two-component system, NarL family, nitrate/nitrite response regulator NarL